MKNNKKGFTLIELLAVIVILAIIALITAPIILNVIEDARRDSAKDKAWGVVDAIKLAYAQDQTGSATYTLGTPIDLKPSTGSPTLGSVAIKASGEMPASGQAMIQTDGSIVVVGLKFNKDGYTCATQKSEDSKDLDSNNMVCLKDAAKIKSSFTD